MSLALCLAAVAPATAQTGATAGQWRYYGGDIASTKYSALTQINRDNFADLEIAWRWSSPENALIAENNRLRTIAYEPTPLMIASTSPENSDDQEGILYISSSLSQVSAINAITGETIWNYDPETWKAGRPTNLGFVHRGVAYWTDGEAERVLIATGDSRLISIDAKTGKPDPNFGENGEIDLKEGLRRPINPKVYAVSSPPIICRDVVAVGSSIFDGPTMKSMPPGDVRGFDVRTGEVKWIFESIPQEGDFGNETWENDSWKYTGNANVWTIMSADPELGYMYLPFGTPTNDWYGGHRLGDNLFAESLVCVDAETGERIWHFQTTHHGVWDYDLPSAPSLIDITVDGKPIKAVAQITKQGFVFVLDRVTGEPVWPIEERPVPASDVEGEKLSPTQPFPTKPPAYERQGVSVDDLIDFTPELREEAEDLLSKFHYGPLFTPPTTKGTINLPGWAGGSNWCGAAFDPETQMYYVPSITSPIRVELQQPDANRSDLKYVRGGDMRVRGPQGLPLFKPPWSRITSYNMNKGEVAWVAPTGEGPRDHPLLKDLNLPRLGSGSLGFPVLTKELLIVAAGARGARSARDKDMKPPKPMFSAFDKATGELIHEREMDASPGGSPMTYMAGGKQYIVMPVGGRRDTSELIAYALP